MSYKNEDLFRREPAKLDATVTKLRPGEERSVSVVDWDIAAPDSTVRVLVIHTEEDWEIARECWKLAHGS